MRHDWEHVSRVAADLSGMYLRRCKNCGAEQERTQDHNWGRVIGTRWLPLVGRCKGQMQEKLA